MDSLSAQSHLEVWPSGFTLSPESFGNHGSFKKVVLFSLRQYTNANNEIHVRSVIVKGIWRQLTTERYTILYHGQLQLK